MRFQTRLVAFSQIREFLKLPLSEKVKRVLADSEVYVERGTDKLIKDYLKPETEIFVPEHQDLKEFINAFPHYQYIEGVLFTRQIMTKEEKDFLISFFPEQKLGIQKAFRLSRTSYLDLMKGNQAKQALAQEYTAQQNNLFKVKNRNKFKNAEAEVVQPKRTNGKAEKELKRIELLLKERTAEILNEIKHKNKNYPKMFNGLRGLHDQFQNLQKNTSSDLEIPSAAKILLSRIEKLVKYQIKRQGKTEITPQELRISRFILRDMRHLARETERTLSIARSKKDKKTQLLTGFAELNRIFENKLKSRHHQTIPFFILVINHLVINIHNIKDAFYYAEGSERDLMSGFLKKWLSFVIEQKKVVTKCLLLNPELNIRDSRQGLVIDYEGVTQTNDFPTEFIYQYILLSLSRSILHVIDSADQGYTLFLKGFEQSYDYTHKFILEGIYRRYHEAFHLTDTSLINKILPNLIKH